MLPYEQLKPSLFKWAAHYVSYKHDLWELVSEAWLSPYVRKLTNVKYASLVVRFAMLHYIREYSHKRVKTSLIIQRLMEREILTTDKRFGQINGEDLTRNILESPCLTPNQKYALRRQCVFGNTYREIAEVLKCTPQNVAWLILGGIEKLRLCIKKGS